MVAPLAVGLAAIIGLAAPVVAQPPGPSTAAGVRDFTTSPRQSPVDADLYLADASGHWADPRCVGDGRRGPRVQPVFVHRKGRSSRFEQFEPVLRRSLSLTTGIFERSSGTRRTVRWVHDRMCQPVIWRVEVPDSMSRNLVDLRTYLTETDARFRDPDRVYSLWVDATTSPQWSGLGGDRWSATWSSSWGFVWVDAHELVHALGALRPDAPHSTGKGHCFDGYDVMCYRDSGPAWRKVIACPAPASQFRLDCGNDDYFALEPRRGSWLARNPAANVARSRFLARVPARALPGEPPPPTGVARDADSVDWQMQPGVRYDVGVTDGDGSLAWLVQDDTTGSVSTAALPTGSRVFVRAVNEAGYSRRVQARTSVVAVAPSR